MGWERKDTQGRRYGMWLSINNPQGLKYQSKIMGRRDFSRPAGYLEINYHSSILKYTIRSYITIHVF